MASRQAAPLVKGQRVKCWGIIGGPFPGRIVEKGRSKDCWIVRLRNRDGCKWKEELHEDHIFPKE